jgi:hypothetical protein
LIGAITDTDKSSATHDYLVHYDRLFRDHIASDFNFIEIGIFRGASLAMLRQYFEGATIVGVDIVETCQRYATDRINVEIGSQVDPVFLADLVQRYPPRIVIDDGSHMAEHVVFTFEALFSSVEPGGIYVVEDLHFHEGSMGRFTRGNPTDNPLDYFLALSRFVMARVSADGMRWGWQTLAETVDEVVFFGHAAAIRKKAPRRCYVEDMMRIAEADGTADAWERAGQYFAGNEEREAAIAAYQRAAAMSPKARTYRTISGLQFDSNGDGASVGDDGWRSWRSSRRMGSILDNLLVNERRFEEAVKIFRDALAMEIHPVVRERVEEKVKTNLARL